MILNYANLEAQDSVEVYQEKARLFSNYYVFLPNNTFRHYFWTDDGQEWYGTGTFKDKGKKRLLRFGDPDTRYKTVWQVHYESNFQRVLKKMTDYKFKSKDFYATTRKRRVVFSPHTK